VTDRRPKIKTTSDYKGAPDRRSEAVRIKLLGGFSVSVGFRIIVENEW
jgi:hypothetical protein